MYLDVRLQMDRALSHPSDYPMACSADLGIISTKPDKSSCCKNIHESVERGVAKTRGIPWLV